MATNENSTSSGNPTTTTIAAAPVATTTAGTTSSMADSNIRNVINNTHSYLEWSKIEKPEQDDRDYLHLVLENQLQVLLVSDPNTDKSSAALDVHVGHLCDPEEFSGLAHFCEHLLFMGTEKYPRENEYSQFLSEHGGHSNAFTGAENTNYFFDVNATDLEGALDRFAQFFIHPLFNESCTERELLAVDSEHKKNIQSDSWRLYQLEKDLSNPNHPYIKFGTGNLETLKHSPESKGLDIRKTLLDFHAKYYSANIMRLVILGKEPIEVLKKWAVGKFSEVKNANILVPAFAGHPLTSDQLQKFIYVKPVKDLRCLEITFPFPDLIMKYKSQPSRYISHLIGHESEGSILSYLKKKGWAMGLHAGASRGGENFEFFRVSVDLTESGVENYEEVAVVIFQYIKLLQNSPIEKWIFDECAKVASIAFRFKEKGSPSSYASRVAGQMHHYDRQDTVSGPYLMNEFDEVTIRSLINLLTADKCKITFVSSDFDSATFDKARFYGTEYTVLPFEDEFEKRLVDAKPIPELHLPLPNQFIPEDFGVKKIPTPENLVFSKIILSNDRIRAWHKQDDTFFVPKANSWFQFISHEAYGSPKQSVQSRLFTDLLKDALMEYSYYAEVAGLSYNLDSNTDGILLVIEGYNDKIHMLLKTLLEKIVHFKVDPERFRIVKEHLRRAYKNWFMESPHQHAIYYVSYATQETLWNTTEKLEALENIDVASLERFKEAFLAQLNVESFIHGNIDKKTATSLAELVLKSIPYEPLAYSKRFPSMRTQLLPIGSHYIVNGYVRNQENLNSAIEYYLQVGDYEDDVLRAKVSLFAQIINEPCFDQLRTKEQLGYMVFSGIRKQTGVIGLRVIIQSEKHPLYLESRVEVFLAKMKQVLADMSETEFRKHAISLSTKLTEKDKNLSQESKKLWAHINSRYYDFTQANRDAETVLKLRKEEIQLFYDEFVDPASNLRKKLSVHVVSHKAESVENLPEIDAILLRNTVLKEEDILDLKFDLALSKAAKPRLPLENYIY